jgi:hypothetical protein
MHRNPDVAMLCVVCLTRVQTHPNGNGCVGCPIMFGERPLRVDRGQHGVTRTLEGEREAIALLSTSAPACRGK